MSASKSHPFEALPCVSRAEFETRRALARWRGPSLDRVRDDLQLGLAAVLGVDVLVGPARWSFSTLTGDDADEGVFQTALSRSGTRVCALAVDLRLALAVVDACFERQPDFERHSRPLSAMEEGLLTAHCSWCLREFGERTGLNLSTALEPTSPIKLQKLLSSKNSAKLVFQASIGAVSGRVSLRFPTEDLEAILDQHELPVEWLPSSARPCGLSSGLEMTLGRVTLQRADLSHLEVGGLVLGITKHRGVVLDFLTGGRSLFQCQSSLPSTAEARETWRVKTPFAPEATMSQDKLHSLRVGDLPVEVTLSLGKVQVPVRELENMREGDVLDVGQPLEREVILLAAGKELGRGQLVRVGEALGLKITAVTLPTSASR